MQVEQVITEIDQILVTEFELEPTDVVPTATLREDLDLDSLDAVDLVVALERRFGIRVEDKVALEMRTVADIHAYVRDHFDPAKLPQPTE